MKGYSFGAGGFLLGERVELMTTGERGYIIAEVVHLSGCNTYQVLLPVAGKDGKGRIANIDHLILRKLDSDESVHDKDLELTDDNAFCPKGTDVNTEWLQAALDEGKEVIPEIDGAVGVEEITIRPGTKAFCKLLGIPVIVQYVVREAYSKELVYGTVYMKDGEERSINCHAYALVPMELIVDVYPEEDGSKTGPVFDDTRSGVQIGSSLSITDFTKPGL